MLSSSPRLVTRELQGKCNQSCQQYRSNNSISPKPATKRFLIFRIEFLIFVDELSAHRTPPFLPPGGKMEKGYQLPAKPYKDWTKRRINSCFHDLKSAQKIIASSSEADGRAVLERAGSREPANRGLAHTVGARQIGLHSAVSEPLEGLLALVGCQLDRAAE